MAAGAIIGAVAPNWFVESRVIASCRSAGHRVSSILQLLQPHMSLKVLLSAVRGIQARFMCLMACAQSTGDAMKRTAEVGGAVAEC